MIIAMLTAAPPPTPSKKSHAGGIVAIFLAIIVLIIIVFFAFTNLSFFTSFFNFSSNTTATNTPITTVPGTSLTISYPPNYNALVNYSLGLINSDRAKFNVSAVTLSPILSGQEHAYSMYEYGYFSHWDVQGYKPYMRYSILNGTGAVEENVAFENTTGDFGTFTNLQTEENAIFQLEHDMVYNDYQCCQNGHLYNIINPYHNRVSIGIMFNAYVFYFVEDFENYYVNLNTPIFNASNENVILQGSPITPVHPDSVIVSYDPLPTAINASVLNSQYQRPYDEGTFLGGAIPCPNGLVCRQFGGSNAITVKPTTWVVSNSSINIVFSLQRFIAEEGSGVYTIYLTQNTFSNNSNDTESLTSLSIFIQT
jgi:uncharacterized protein YkwD